MPARMAMMAMTTRSSMRVKADCAGLREEAFITRRGKSKAEKYAIAFSAQVDQMTLDG